MFLTKTPYQSYFDLDGRPLNDGAIYFGLENQNPETNRIAVYWDAGGLQPADQPIKTMNGYTVRSGTPANIYVASEYSTTVRNRHGQLVYTLASSLAFDQSQFLQTGTGAVLRSMQNKLRDIISAADFGFSPTATAANNKLYLQAAIDSLGTDGGEIIIPRGRYNVAPGIIIDNDSKNVTITGAGNGMGYEDSHAGTTITFTAGTTGFDCSTVVSGGNYTLLRGMSINGGGVCANGIKIVGQVMLEHMDVTGCTAAGIWLFDYINQVRLSHVSSGYNTAGYGLLVGGTGNTGNNTIFSVEHCTFRRNSVGVRITNASHVKFSDCVVESNYLEGLELYKPTGVPCDYIEFDLCHFEYNNSGTSNYNVTMNSQTLNYTSGPPFAIVFSNCKMTCSGSTKALNAISARNCVFRYLSSNGVIDLGVYCSTSSIESNNTGTVTDLGNRNFILSHDASYSGGLEMTGGQLREPSKGFSYVWDAWNPSDIVGTSTTAPATGTAMLGPHNFVIANVAGTLTATFQHIGKYLISITESMGSGLAYTGANMFITLGGTATRKSARSNYTFTGDAAVASDFTGSINFLVDVTVANQTLTIRPQGRVSAGAGALSSWQFTAEATGLFIGA